jgi:hypothetical protein
LPFDGVCGSDNRNIGAKLDQLETESKKKDRCEEDSASALADGRARLRRSAHCLRRERIG